MVDGEVRKTHLFTFQGDTVFEGLKRFYTTVSGLYANGNLGGLDIYAQKPLGW